MASFAVKPKIRSAAGFHSTILPSFSTAMIASPAACMKDSKSMLWSITFPNFRLQMSYFVLRFKATESIIATLF